MYRKLKLAVLFVPLFIAMFAILIIALISMEVRNIGRWLNKWGEFMIGDSTYYKDLWPLTMGSLWETFKRG